MPDFTAAFEQVDQFVRQKMTADKIPGLALAITDREQLLHVAVYGYADLAARIPVTPETLFEFGSIGKSFTNIALLQLVEAGLVDLHKPVRDYLPWFEVQTEYAPITLHHLLSHSAGITTGSDFSGEPYYEVYALRSTQTSSAPGTRFHYSNVGYKTIGLVLETLLGQDYETLMRQRVLDPLGLRDTSATTNAIRPRLAVGYIPYDDDRPLSPERKPGPAPWFETNTADGCMSTTAPDLAAYLRMLLNRGYPGVLSEAGYALMTQRIMKRGEDDYGYGLAISEIDGCTHIAHGGGMVGYAAILMGDVDNGLGAVALTNCNWAEQRSIAIYALQAMRAVLNNTPLPEISIPPDRTKIENAAEYAGVYTSDAKTLTLVAEGNRLILQHKGQRIPLERRAPDHFYADHPDFDLFLLTFGREDSESAAESEKPAGKVVELFYGGDWYTNSAYSGPRDFDYPELWNAFPGHYRSHNPWITNFRVVLRKGSLVFIYATGGIEGRLVPLGDNHFRLGEDEGSPETIRFDTVLNGLARRATFALCDFYRTFTP